MSDVTAVLTIIVILAVPVSISVCMTLFMIKTGLNIRKMLDRKKDRPCNMPARNRKRWF